MATQKRLLQNVATELTSNLVGQVRRATLKGKQYLVAPLSMIVPGVLPGSRGPLYYPPEEIANNFDAWNGMPIVVYHPTKDGRPISARDPEVLEKQGIGMVLKAKVNNKLTAEGWFDIEAMTKVDARVLQSLMRGEAIELSTGLYTDNEVAQNGAHYNGKSYTHIARNYRPDHLAILPDQKGACSISDGCGVLINAKDKKGAKGANCGIGPNGFTSGNTCAKGGGSSGAISGSGTSGGTKDHDNHGLDIKIMRGEHVIQGSEHTEVFKGGSGWDQPDVNLHPATVREVYGRVRKGDEVKLIASKNSSGGYIGHEDNYGGKGYLEHNPSNEKRANIYEGKVVARYNGPAGSVNDGKVVRVDIQDKWTQEVHKVTLAETLQSIQVPTRRLIPKPPTSNAKGKKADVDTSKLSGGKATASKPPSDSRKANRSNAGGAKAKTPQATDAQTPTVVSAPTAGSTPAPVSKGFQAPWSTQKSKTADAIKQYMGQVSQQAGQSVQYVQQVIQNYLKPELVVMAKKAASKGANCGIGPNGFSSGNSCAKGGGGDKASKQSYIESRIKANLKRHKSATNPGDKKRAEQNISILKGDLKRLGVKESKYLRPTQNRDGQFGASNYPGGKRMALKKVARDRMVGFITTNCSCWEGREETLSGLSDDALKQVKAHVANETRKDEALVALVEAAQEAVGEELAVNELPAALKKAMIAKGGAVAKKKAKSKPAEDEEEVEDEEETTTNQKGSTMNSVDDRLTKEEQEDLAYAREQREKEKTAVVNKLTTHVKDVEQKKTLTANFMKRSLADLKEMSLLVPEVAPVANYAGAAGGPANVPSSGEVDRADTLMVPTINYEDEYKSRYGKTA